MDMDKAEYPLMLLLKEVRLVSNDEPDMRSVAGARGDVLVDMLMLAGEADRKVCDARKEPSDAK